jgi:hypothetical protein
MLQEVLVLYINLTHFYFLILHSIYFYFHKYIFKFYFKYFITLFIFYQLKIITPFPFWERGYYKNGLIYKFDL